MTGTGPFVAVSDGVRVAIRVTPKASRTAATGIAATADGGAVVRVAVTAAPEDGKANQAVIKLLSKEWHMAKSSISLLSGHTDRNKVLQVAGDPGPLLAALTAWGQTLPQEPRP
ncbi:MAG: DUF167 family protein [Azospirillaceae bacterium]|nr:DUF167 family protein [Azospirillaceae bacterium]